MRSSNPVADHYTHGSLERAIFAALSSLGADHSRLMPADLAPVDEFHIGGRQATIDLAENLEFATGNCLLDIGSGLGGASRYFALERGCFVTGIDVTEEYVRVAEVLSARVGLQDQVSYRLGDARSLPFAPRSFDGAYMLHVGMNIRDKGELFREVHRVLKPQGLFAIYDVMRERTEGELVFPVPWASEADISFVETATVYRGLLDAAGFVVERQRSRRDFALDFYRRLQRRPAVADGYPQLGLHILMGASAPQKLDNMISMLERRLIAPTHLISRAG